MQTLPLPLLGKIGELSASRYPIHITFEIYDNDENNLIQNEYNGQETVMIDASMNFDFNNEQLEAWFTQHIAGMRPPSVFDQNEEMIIETDGTVVGWIRREHQIVNPNDVFNPRMGWRIMLYCHIAKPDENHIFTERIWADKQWEFRRQLCTEVAPAIMRHLFAPSTSPFNEEGDDPFYDYKVVDNKVFTPLFFRSLRGLVVKDEYDFNFELQNNMKVRISADEDDETFVVPYRLKM